jgi:hypothetical protein
MIPNRETAAAALLVVVALFACKASDDDSAESQDDSTETSETEPKQAKGETAPIETTGRFAGGYQIASASDAAGKAYSGTVQVDQSGDVYRTKWSNGARGVALERGSILASSKGTPGQFVPGIAMYDVEGGTLEGTWADYKAGKLGSETLEGPEGLSGTYQIEKGVLPSGKTYSGTVEISKVDDVYAVTVKTEDGKPYSGVGLLLDNTFVVAYGSSHNGVVAYRRTGKNLKGTSARTGKTSTGTEVLHAN